MNNKDFKIYREGHLEGYNFGLKDMANFERRFRLEEYKNSVYLEKTSKQTGGNK